MLRKEERQALHDLLTQELDNAMRLEEGDPKADKAVQSIKTLGDLAVKQDQLTLEERKVENESKRLEIESEKLAFEKTKLYSQSGANRRKEVIDTIVAVGTSAANLAFYTVFLTKGFAFETEGTIGSTTFRNLLSGIKPPKM